MLNLKFKKRFPFAYNYFSNFIDLLNSSERKFPQALIFEGADTTGQYLFALELARVLNCQKNGDIDCDCINCNWIRNFNHPCVNKVSQIHFKGEGDETKTVISVKQAKQIEQNLLLSSDYHRFFIFFSSDEKQYQNDELVDFLEFGYSSNVNHTIEPLNYSTFNTATPNALLKSIEEPPNKTTFVFLTKSKEDILSTIVSRCLVFKLNGNRDNLNYQNLEEIFKKYHSLNYDNAFEFSFDLQSIVKENEYSFEQVLNLFMEYLKDLIKLNIDNFSFVQKLKNDINIINHSIAQSRASMQDKIVLDTMVLKLIRGY